MARCRFTPLAKQDLKEINRFIALDNSDAARRFIALIKQKCQILAEFPELGRSWYDFWNHYADFAPDLTVEILSKGNDVSKGDARFTISAIGCWSSVDYSPRNSGQ